MFKKYFTYEIKNSYKLPVFTLAIVTILCLITFYAGYFKIKALFLFISAFLGITFVWIFIMCIITIFKTMRERLFSKTGYLTFMMPVKTHTILLTKLLVNFIYIAIFYLAIILSGVTLSYAISRIYTDAADNGLFTQIIGLYIEDILANPLVSFLVILANLLGIAAILCLLLFSMAIFNSGIFKHEKSIVKFVVVFCFIIALNFILKIDIIPLRLYYDSTSKVFLIFQSNNLLETLSAYNDKTGVYPTSVLNFSLLFWSLVAIFGGYFASYRLVNNKLELE